MADDIRPKKRIRTDGNDRSRQNNADLELLMDHLFTATSVAPWLTADEWMDVYRQLTPALDDPENSQSLLSVDLERAGRIVDSCWSRAWGTKNEAIQTTVIVLKALKALAVNDGTALLSASMAVIRFIKTVSESATDRMFRRPPIVETCGSLGVPSWIVRIRHDGSHGEMQEPRDLYDALVFATRWLKTNFWDAEVKRISCQSYMMKTAQEESDFPNAEEIETVIAEDIRSLIVADYHSWKRKSRYQGILESLRCVRWDDLEARGKRSIRRLEKRKRTASKVMIHLDFYLERYMENFVRVLVTNFLCLATSDVEPSGENDHRDPCVSLLSKEKVTLAIIVEKVIRFPGGTNSLLQGLMKLLGDSSSNRAYLACAWALFVMDRIPRNTVSSVRIWDAFDWRRVVEAALLRPSTYVSIVLNKLTYWVSNAKEHRFLQDCRRFASISVLGKPSAVAPLGLTNPDRLHARATYTLQSLLEEVSTGVVADSGSLKTGRWTKANELNWEGVPLGSVPGAALNASEFYNLLTEHSDGTKGSTRDVL